LAAKIAVFGPEPPVSGAIEAGDVVAAGPEIGGLVISLTGSNRSIIILTILLDSLPRR
jgi:hypothetical protein